MPTFFAAFVAPDAVLLPPHCLNDGVLAARELRMQAAAGVHPGSSVNDAILRDAVPVDVHLSASSGSGEDRLERQGVLVGWWHLLPHGRDGDVASLLVVDQRSETDELPLLLRTAVPCSPNALRCPWLETVRLPDMDATYNRDGTSSQPALDELRDDYSMYLREVV